LIGDFTHVSVNATVAGRSRIGRFGMVGAGATIIDGVEIVDHVTIGAGAVVIRSLRQPGVYVGIPVREINS
jgi:acetyltransferase-like isoleucine patch superfamily enzyme